MNTASLVALRHSFDHRRYLFVDRQHSIADNILDHRIPDLRQAIADALRRFTPQECANYLAAAGWEAI
jgi:hypothetical protein